LTANGNLLATASVKGTLLRVWDVATSSMVHEFRRGVERANITCLAFSWDDQWLGCCSDKGTAHVFYCETKPTEEPSKKSSFTRRLFSPTSGGNFQPKSVCQVRGVPHPLACAFLGDTPNVLAVAGWDADGNGVLLVSEFAAHQEARRIAYHVLVKNNNTNNNNNPETEDERRRRRARGWKPQLPETPNHDFGNLQISEQQQGGLVTTVDHDNGEDDDDFCEVIVEPPQEPVVTEERVMEEDDEEEGHGEAASSAAETSSKGDATLQDSVRTEPLDDDPEPTEEPTLEATQ
jgi:hypothetical protein